MGLEARKGDLVLIPQGRPDGGPTPEWMLAKVVAVKGLRAVKFKLLRGKSFERDYGNTFIYVLPYDKFTMPVDTILSQVPTIYDSPDDARGALREYRIEFAHKRA